MELFMFLGKTLIAIGLCFQAYILVTNQAIGSDFDASLTKIFSACDCLPPNV